MAAEITETTRLFGRCVARIEAGLAGESGRSPDQAQLLRRALGKEIDAGRRLGADDALRRGDQPQAAHPLRPAGAGRGARNLHPPGAGGEEIDESFAKRWPFFQHNQKLIRDIEKIEHKQRRQDVLVDDELIFAFYDSLIPEGIHNGATFDHWRKEAERDNPSCCSSPRTT
jgi:ATP-dependent helicase HrpA